jgi:hypothetical protein
MSDHYIEMCYSDDGGHNWSNWQARDLGDTGDFDARKVWRRLGMTRQRVFKFRVTSPVKCDLIAASVQVEDEG